MTRLSLLTALCLLSLGPLAAAQLSTISQSIDSVNVAAGNSVECQNGFGFTAVNNHYRAYNTSVQGLFANFSVVAVRFGVETIFSLDGSGVLLTMRVYSDPTPGNLATVNDLVLLAQESFILPDQNQTVVERRFACPPVFVVNGVDDLVVEVFAENGATQGKAFFIGSNTAGEIAPSFIALPACGITAPINTQSLHTPPARQDNILDVVVDSTATATSPALYNGTCEDLNLFTGVGGATLQDGPGNDVQTMAVGDTMTLDFVSPLGSFDNSSYLVLGTVFPTNLMDGTDVPELMVPNPIPSAPPLDSLYVGTTTSVIADGNSLPFGLPQFLPAGGLQLSFAHPGGVLTGNSILIQAVVVAPFGGPTPVNVFYASTNGTEVVFQ